MNEAKNYINGSLCRPDEREEVNAKAERYMRCLREYNERTLPYVHDYASVEVVIPLTEGLNIGLELGVPTGYKDADNETLMGYFNHYVCNIDMPDIMNEFIDGSDTPYLDDPFAEFAQIKGGVMSIKFGVFENEGPIPHFHFYKGCAPEKGIPRGKLGGGGCICIMKDCYFSHGNHTDTLSAKEIKALKKFLMEKNGINGKLTNWEYIIMLWNNNNPDQQEVPSDAEMPDWTSGMDTIQFSIK